MTPRLVLVTASNAEEARRIAEALLQPRLAACVNIVSGVESHYWWQGKVERGSEVLLVVKTSAEQFEAVADVVRATHSYACPEIVAINPAEIAPGYRAWWTGELRGPGEG
jgi:periplasmic divalent cation tolerance protein